MLALKGSDMKIFIGADHRGVALKAQLIEHFTELEFVDQGAFSDKRTDYPYYAQLVCKAVQKTPESRGILICGSGVGMSIAANRFCGIYAALCWSVDVAQAAAAHDRANVLVLSAEFVSRSDNQEIVAVWLATPFLGGVYENRLVSIEAMQGE